MFGVITKRRDLFGGALRLAGLAAAAMMTTSATADFVPAADPGGGVNLLRVFGQGDTVFVNDSDFSPAGFPAAQGYVSAGLQMGAVAFPTVMAVALDLTDDSTWNVFAIAQCFQWFTVENTKEVDLAWDFTNADASTGYVLEYGVGNVHTAAHGTAGSVSLTLLPGKLYQFVGEVQQNGNIGGGSIELTNIPAPGALALLGLAGLCGGRRRRRE